MDCCHVQRPGPGTFVVSALYLSLFSHWKAWLEANPSTPIGNQTVSVKSTCNAKHLIDLAAGNSHVLAGFYSPCPWTACVKLFRSSAAPRFARLTRLRYRYHFTVLFSLCHSCLCFLFFFSCFCFGFSVSVQLQGGGDGDDDSNNTTDMGTTFSMTRPFSSSVSGMIQFSGLMTHLHVGGNY